MYPESLSAVGALSAVVAGGRYRASDRPAKRLDLGDVEVDGGDERLHVRLGPARAATRLDDFLLQICGRRDVLAVIGGGGGGRRLRCAIQHRATSSRLL